MSLKNKRILIGLTGGIAAYKVPYLVRDIVKAEGEVRVIMTQSATRFITPLTLETVSGQPVDQELFPPDEFVATRHIDLANWPDLVLIAPATANFIGKAANGICDDLLTTIVCASPKPKLVAPAMNPTMWEHRPTQKNVAYLKEIGWQFVGPGTGEMACDHWGEGRMVEPEQIFEAASQLLSSTTKKKVKEVKKVPIAPRSLENKKIIVTAGPCREPIDPVRYISNRSSGKMGVALAQAARDLGADVTLVAGPMTIAPPSGIETINVETTEEMYRAISPRFARCDAVIMAAAPADLRPAQEAQEKIKKRTADLNLPLAPTIDILKRLGARKKKQVLVGFALETENGVTNARRKLKEKRLDLIVLNSPREVGAGFDHDTNRVTLIRPGRKPEVWPLLSKFEVAGRLLAALSRML